MEYADKVQWLRRYQQALQIENERAEELEQLRTEAARMTPLLSDVPSGGGGKDRLPEAVEKIVEAQQELQCQINCAKSIRGEILDVINILPDKAHEILRRKYILGQNWQEIQHWMKYSGSHCYKLHKAAVKMILNDKK